MVYMKNISLALLLLWCLLSSCNRQTPTYRIGFSQCSDDEWRHRLNEEILREALFYDGVDVEILTAQDNNHKQINDIKYFIENKKDLIIVSPNEGVAITPIVEEAFDKGIPVIVVDRKILSDKYTAYVGADNYQIGKAVGSYITNLLNGKGNIIEIKGLSGSTPALERHQGFVSIIKKHPDIRVIDQYSGNWRREPAHAYMDSILNIYTEIDLVYSHNDRMASGAVEAATQVGRNRSMYFIGIDALPGKGYGLEMVNDSSLTATFIYPTGGDKVIQTAMRILMDEPFERENILTTAVIDATNARVMDLQTNHIKELDGKIQTLNNRIDSFWIRYSHQKLLLYSILIILLLLGGLLIVVFKSLQSKNRLNGELSKQKIQLETQRDTLAEQHDRLLQLSNQLEEATHAKLVFFTNISHDFRTPLTLVADPIHQLLADGSLSSNQQRRLSIVQRNVNILLRLVNQILDFRKYENGKMEYNASEIDLLNCLKTWNEAFIDAARTKHIKFVFEASANTDFHTFADVEKLERIYYNLLSNALKFTPENGKVVVQLSTSKNQEGNSLFRFSVFNTGSLIEAEHIQNIFDRFYKIDMHHAGSGIGLALVKAFVEMHGGHISVASEQTEGTTFTVEIPQVAADTTAIRKQLTCPEETFDEGCDDNEEEIDYTTEKKIVLIVDDNADIRMYIKELLQNEYIVIEASNGAQGLRKANKYVPDVIVSDVMMPGIDGFEFCSRIKSEIQTCHIPLIMLTACSLDEHRIQGYDGGADSYISKPFNSQILLSRIQNLIASHHRLKAYFSDQTVSTREDVTDLDQQFIDKFQSIIKEKMGDATLNVEDLSKEMGLSRVQLYRKLKSLTQYSPNELLRIERLKRAAKRIVSSDLSISEIAYETGFTAPSYFAKCFKDYFGESPTEYQQKRNQ